MMRRVGIGAGADGDGVWVCPECGGEVRPEGRTEREPVRCRACGVRFRHPKLAILLSLALPGLGSICQRRWIWGIAVMAFGSAAFLGTLWRLFVHLRSVMTGSAPDLPGLLLEAGAGTGLVMIAYLLDLLAVWLRRGRLVRA